MKTILTSIIPLSLAVSISSQASQTEPTQSQTIIQNGAQASMKGPEAYFTGTPRIDPLFPVSESTNVSGAYVTFAPGERSAWHTHPAGQTLIVTAGKGWTQVWNGPIEEINPGDVVICPPGVKHWHGATPTTAMTHLTITGDKDGKNVEWLEKVSDEQYKK